MYRTTGARVENERSKSMNQTISTKSKTKREVAVAVSQTTRPWPLGISFERSVALIDSVEDCIEGVMRPEPLLASNQASIVLSAAPGITWWKGVEVVSAPDISAVLNTRNDAEGTGCKVLGGAYTQASYSGPSSSCFTIPSPSAQTHLFLRFRKAGMFGVHTTMYAMPLSLPTGTSLHIGWQRDE